MVKKLEPCTPAAGGTPWKGRLRSHHETPLCFSSPRIPSSGAKSRVVNGEARTFKKPPAAPKTPAGRSRSTRDDKDCGSAHRPPRAPPRRPSRLTGRDPEQPIVIDDEEEECEVRGDLSAVTPLRRSARLHPDDKISSKRLSLKECFQKQQLFTPLRRSARLHPDDKSSSKRLTLTECFQKQQLFTPLRRSARLHPDDKSSSKRLTLTECYQKQQLFTPLRRSARLECNHKQQPFTPNPRESDRSRKAHTSVSKDEIRVNPTRNQRSATVKASARMKSHKEPQPSCQDSQDIPPRRKAADVPCQKSQMQEPKLARCEELTRKRKRGIHSSRKQSHPDPKSTCHEIAPRMETGNTIRKKSEKDSSSMMQSKSGEDGRVDPKENNEELSRIEKGDHQQLCGPDDWTEEQDLILREAYFKARPSPHFWKKVSKMVPGKSAEECFNRVHADLSTPTPMAPRARTSKIDFSPLGHFKLSDSKFPTLLEPTVGRRRTAKQKSLAAQKTVRHYLKKHSLIDQAHEADHFSIFETSPSALQLNISLEDSPGTPDNCIKPCSLQKQSASSSARKKPLSRLKPKQTEQSPAVLKPVKNSILHEKYIDQLSRREGTKKPRKSASGTKLTDSVRPLSEPQAGGVKAAKNALISEATDFISTFKMLQANSLAHVLENSDDEDDDCT